MQNVRVQRIQAKEYVPCIVEKPSPLTKGFELHINEVTHVRDRAKTWNVSLERSIMTNIPRELWVDFVMAEKVSEKLHQLSLIAKWVEENEEDTKHAA